MRAVSGELPPPNDDGWAYEVKWDGYRTLAFIEAESARLQSSNLLDVTKKWPGLPALAAGLSASSGVIDGEVCALDEQGRPRFGLLQRGEGAIVFVAFDVLHLEGHDVTPLPYADRRRLLLDAFEPGERWLVPNHHDDGAALLAATAERGLEGIMAKRRTSPYLPGKRSPAWRKVKHRPQQELVIGGWLPGEGNRSGLFASLLLGHYDAPGQPPLRYAGAVGTGFDSRTLADLKARLDALATDECPFDPPPPRAVSRYAHWVRPELAAVVAFAEWTSDGLVRQSSFLGLRDDKDPFDVVRES
jgi:bifunctional non-homologous end joining protein LigD